MGSICWDSGKEDSWQSQGEGNSTFTESFTGNEQTQVLVWSDTVELEP